MFMLVTAWLCAALLAAPVSAQDSRSSRLVDLAWLQAHRSDVLLLDASMTPQHQAAHIPGAVSADLYRYGVQEPSRSAMQQRMQSWGVSPGRKIVVYDQGADMMATRLFYDLYYHGVPASDLFILDGGLAKWRAQGGAVTQAATPPVPAGTWRITAVRDEVRVRLPEFFAATGDRARHAVVEALEPPYHYGAQKFFDRAGHVPNAVLMPSSEFFNADKTFKSPEEIRRQAAYLGVRPEQVVHSHCGGGVAASVPWFALHFMAGYPQVKIYLESQREWLQDDRSLPFWTYSAQQLLRSSSWLDGWNAPMLRAFGVVRLNIVDVRPAALYALGHVPFALNLPADTLRQHLGRPQALAALLGPAGVNPAYEVVLVSDGALTPAAALAFLAFEQLGQPKLSLLMDSVDEWGLRGHPLTKAPTGVGSNAAPGEASVPAATYTPQLRAGVLVSQPLPQAGAYPRVFIAAGKGTATRQPQGTVLQLPYTELLNADGTPKPAKDLWARITAAGVPRYAELVFFADDPAEAAVNYVVFKLMGWPDIKVLLN